MNSPELVLTESATLRSQHFGRVEVLDKVKAMTMLADDVHATTEIVADFFEVDAETVKKVVQRNRPELESNGYRVVRGSDIREFEGDNLSLTKVRALALFERRTILNLAMLLTGSDVARQVRTLLLDLDAASRGSVVALASTPTIDQVEETTAIIRMLGTGVEVGLLDRSWAAGKAQLRVARVMGEAPELPETLTPLYVPDFLKAKGLTAKDINSVQSWFGRRAVEIGEANGVDVPALRPTEQPNGSIRETRAWRREHLPLFEEVWNTYYAEKYERPMFLELGAA
jgi:hypothetical protein